MPAHPGTWFARRSSATPTPRAGRSGNMSRVQLALVVNPRSGAGRSAEQVAELLAGPGHDVRTFPIDRAEEAAASGSDRLVLAGGDGSVGTAFAACARHGVPLAVLPAGTANDFARALGIPPGIEAAVPVATDPDPGRRTVWGGSIDGKPFVNVASIGLGVYAAEQAAPLKRVLGPVAYGIGAAIATVRGRAARARVIVDGDEVFDGDVWQVLVAASGSFGGVVQLPVSDPETPELEAFVLPAGPRLSLVRRAWGMRHGGNRGGVQVFQGHRIVVDLDPDRQWNVDGDVFDLGDVTVAPLGPVDVLVPRDGDPEAAR